MGCSKQVEPRKAFIRPLERAASRHHLARVWSDWCEAAAIALRQPIDPRGRAAREARYMAIVNRYEPDEWRELASMLGALVELLEHAGLDTDPLADIYMELGVGNTHLGQFFTPGPLCRLIADLTLDARIDEVIERRGFVTVDDPAVGAGSTLLAIATTLRARGFNPQTQLHATGTDVSATCAHMAYLNLTLRGLPALIRQGNTLTLEVVDTWPTFAHRVGSWDLRLAAARMREAVDELQPTSTQLALF